MPVPDMSALSRRDQVTYWIGSVTRDDMIVEAMMRRALRDLSGVPWEASAEGEPFGFERVRERLKVAVRSSPLMVGQVADVVTLLGVVKEVHDARVALVHSLWIEQGGFDVFQREDALMNPTAGQWAVDEFKSVARRMAFIVARMSWFSMGVSTLVRSVGADHPLMPRAWAMMRGEFDLDDNDALVPHDPVLRKGMSFD